MYEPLMVEQYNEAAKIIEEHGLKISNNHEMFSVHGSVVVGVEGEEGEEISLWRNYNTIKELAAYADALEDMDKIQRIRMTRF